MKLWLVSSKRKDAVFEVLEYNPETKMAKLRGRYAVFEQTIDAPSMKKSGYKLVKENPHA